MAYTGALADGEAAGLAAFLSLPFPAGLPDAFSLDHLRPVPSPNRHFPLHSLTLGDVCLPHGLG